MGVNYLILLLMSLWILGCAPSGSSSSAPVADATTCRDPWDVVDSNGYIIHYYQFLVGGVCHTNTKPMTNWEETAWKWNKNKIKCVPQVGFSSKSYMAANNYYTYRDGRIYLDLDAGSGEYRMLWVGEKKDGASVFERKKGCFYVRTDYETEPVNPQDYGSMIMLSSDNAISTRVNPIDEIYNYTVTGINFDLFDTSSLRRRDWTYYYCPFDTVPWGFCDKLRNGNIMYYPDVSVADQAALLNEAYLIRSAYSYAEITSFDFANAWSYYEANAKEEFQGGSWVYFTKYMVDAQEYVYWAWIDYMKRDRPSMPDLDSTGSTPLCFNGSRGVTYSNGSTGKVYGQSCYSGGTFSFTGIN